MPDLKRALTDIDAIRVQLARVSEFRGFGPSALAATGALALAVAAAQARWLSDPAAHVHAYIALWSATAVCALLVIGIDALGRARRAHGSFAVPMLQAALEQFLPALVTGGIITLVFLQAAAQHLWMLPGLWQLVFGLGAFAAARSLPRPMRLVGAWYLVSGLSCLELAQIGYAFSPWAMGVPFGVGQLLVAAILHAEHESLITDA